MNLIKSIFSDIKKFFTTNTSKKIILTILASFLAVIPLILALAYAFYQDNAQKSNLFSLTLYGYNEKEIFFAEEEPELMEEDSIIYLFYNISQSSNKSVAPPDMSASPYVTAAIRYGDLDTKIKCYFTKDGGNAHFIDENGEYFIISEENNLKFLNTSYAEDFYDNARLYSLNTIDKDIIIPKSSNWNYLKANGSYERSNLNESTDKKLTYEITGAIDLGFDTEPDHSLVKVYDKGVLIYEGNIKKLSTITAEAHHSLDVTITAEWYKKDGVESYGNITYDFYVTIKNKSEFTISANSTTPENFLMLTCTNVSDLSKITFSSEDIEISPVFVKDRSSAKALLCFSEFYENSTVEFTVSYGVSIKTFSVKILPAEYHEAYEFADMYYALESAPTKIDQSRALAILDLKIPKNDLVYFQGNFANPDENKFSLAYTHGSRVFWGSELVHSFIAFGNEYIAKDDNRAYVNALENGVVSICGSNDSLGSFVVIDHGCGLRTYYTQLSSLNVSQGDVIVKGQALGKVGSGTHTGQDGFILYCTVYDDFIDPNALFGQ